MLLSFEILCLLNYSIKSISHKRFSKSQKKEKKKNVVNNIITLLYESIKERFGFGASCTGPNEMLSCNNF